MEASNCCRCGRTTNMPLVQLVLTTVIYGRISAPPDGFGAPFRTGAASLIRASETAEEADWGSLPIAPSGWRVADDLVCSRDIPVATDQSFTGNSAIQMIFHYC